MEGLTRIGSNLRRLASWSSSVGNNIGEVPFVGSYLSTLFYRASDYFGVAAEGAYAASSSFDTLARDISGLPQTVERLRDSLTDNIARAIDRVNDQLNSLKNSILSTVNSTISAAVNGVNRTVDNLRASLNDAVSNLKSDLSTVRSRVQNVAAGLASDVWKWIASNVLPAYLANWKNSLQAVVIAWITAATGSLMTEAFKLLVSQWTTFKDRVAWLTEKMLQMMVAEARRFAPVVWSLVEAVTGELSQWKG